MNSYGYIETYGYVASIVAADAALKSANVTLRNCYFVKGGIVTVEITGDVAAVKVAIEVGSKVAKQLGNYISSNVIARLDKETEKILINEQKKEIKKEIKKEVLEEKVEVVKVFAKETEILENTVKEDKNKNTREIKNKINEYQNIRVIELKQKVNDLKLGYTWNQIKSMNRKRLIQIILENE